MLVRFFLSRNYARNPWDLQYGISYFRCNRRPLTRAGRYVLTWLLDHLLPKGPSKWELRKELKLSLEKGPRNVVRPYCAEYEFPYLDVHDGAKQFFFLLMLVLWCGDVDDISAVHHFYENGDANVHGWRQSDRTKPQTKQRVEKFYQHIWTATRENHRQQPLQVRWWKYYQ